MIINQNKELGNILDIFKFKINNPNRCFMFKRYFSLFIATLVVLFVGFGQALNAQGVTIGSLEGLVIDIQGDTLPGANIIAIHLPTGTEYGTSTRADG